HCVLDVSGHAIKRLTVAGLYPIAIFVKPPDVKWIYDNAGADANEESAQKLYEKTVKTEQMFLDLFTAVVQEDTLNDAYEKICQIIEEQENIDCVWVPGKRKNFYVTEARQLHLAPRQSMQFFVLFPKEPTRTCAKAL
ncbi:unnamed protein product, partial [Didymodactylos carnosus]